MSLASDATPQTEALADPKALLNVPVGLASPLWPLFAGAAVSGAAWWWMTRWAQPANLEAMFGAAAKADTQLIDQPAALTEPVVEAVAEAEPALQAAAETLAEPPMEAQPETVLEALVEEPASFAPVGGEAAPISPVLEAMSPEAVEAPKPRRKPAAPTAD